MNKDEALKVFLELCALIYRQHRKLRTYFDDRTMLAFHLVYERLDEVGREFAESELYLGLSFHPFYPVIKDEARGEYYISHYFFHRWVESYLNIMRRIEPLRIIVQLHDNEKDYARAISESWEQFVEPVTYEENAQYAAFVQKQWEGLQAKQLQLFNEYDLG